MDILKDGFLVFFGKMMVFPGPIDNLFICVEVTIGGEPASSFFSMSCFFTFSNRSSERSLNVIFGLKLFRTASAARYLFMVDRVQVLRWVVNDFLEISIEGLRIVTALKFLEN